MIARQPSKTTPRDLSSGGLDRGRCRCAEALACGHRQVDAVSRFLDLIREPGEQVAQALGRLGSTHEEAREVDMGAVAACVAGGGAAGSAGCYWVLASVREGEALRWMRSGRRA